MELEENTADIFYLFYNNSDLFLPIANIRKCLTCCSDKLGKSFILSVFPADIVVELVKENDRSGYDAFFQG